MRGAEKLEIPQRRIYQGETGARQQQQRHVCTNADCGLGGALFIHPSPPVSSFAKAKPSAGRK